MDSTHISTIHTDGEMTEHSDAPATFGQSAGLGEDGNIPTTEFDADAAAAVGEEQFADTHAEFQEHGPESMTTHDDEDTKPDNSSPDLDPDPNERVTDDGQLESRSDDDDGRGIDLNQKDDPSFQWKKEVKEVAVEGMDLAHSQLYECVKFFVEQTLVYVERKGNVLDGLQKIYSEETLEQQRLDDTGNDLNQHMEFYGEFSGGSSDEFQDKTTESRDGDDNDNAQHDAGDGHQVEE